MRIRTLATCFLLALASTACTGELTDDPGTDDPPAGSNDGSNDGSNGGGNPTPTFSVTVDKPTIATERRTTHTVAITVKGSGGFAGDVALAATVVDASGAVMPGWTVNLASTAATVAVDGTTTINAEVKLPSAGPLVGTVKIAASSGSIQRAISSTITQADVITFKVANNGTSCTYEEGGNLNAPIQVQKGTEVHFMNTSAAPIVIHASGQIPHQPDGSNVQQNAFYKGDLTNASVGSATQWYCHSPGAAPPRAQQPTFIIVAP